MSKKQKKPVSSNAAMKYAKLRLGVGSRFRTSCYELAAEALQKDGFPRPADVYSEKLWVFQNAAHILAAVKSTAFRAASPGSQAPSSRKTRKAMYCKPAGATMPSGVDVRSNDFLQTYEWRVLRMQALKLHGARCQCCGATPSDGAVMNVDHIKPRRIFPEMALSLDNLQILCAPCNHGKSNWDMTDWRGGMDDEALEPEQLAHLAAI
jgi:5-methylcytosine-specific restriction endonuclease McrA